MAAAAGDAVIYELHIGTFTPEGTFDAAIDRLDHLVDLGVTHVELMPVAEFPGRRGWGYDGVDSMRPTWLRRSGWTQAVGRRLPRARSRRDARRRLQPPRARRELPRAVRPVLHRHVPHAMGRGRQPRRAESDEVRRFFCDNALMWLRDYHIDGLRLDAVHALFDQSAAPFLEQLAAEVDGLGARLRPAAGPDRRKRSERPGSLRPGAVGGYGFDAVWNEDFHHALHAVLTGERAGYYADFGALADSRRRSARGSSTAGAIRRTGAGVTAAGRVGLDGHRFVGYLQNHDQVGNRARGERLSQLVGPARLRSAPRWCSRAPSCRCSSRARSGGPPPRSGTSPTTRIRRSRARSAMGGGAGSPPSA